MARLHLFASHTPRTNHADVHHSPSPAQRSSFHVAHTRLLAAVIVALFGVAFASILHAQEPPSPPLSYRIDVSVTPATRALDATQTIHWRNTSTEPIQQLPIHLYLNAFSHQHTTWMREGSLQRFPIEDLVQDRPDLWGFIDLSSVTQNTSSGAVALTWSPIQPDDANPLDRSLVSLKLAEEVGPGETLELSLAFQARLPVPVARTGMTRDFALVAQWFPKVAVYEPDGVRGRTQGAWNAHQFHGPTEFYADFASYDVSIHVPKGWLVGATGRQIDAVEQGDQREVRFVQENVHDFAFVVGRTLTKAHAQCPRRTLPPLDVTYIHPVGVDAPIERWQRAVCGALQVFEQRLMPYPYDTLTVIHPPFEGLRTCGMEYPTLITGMFADPIWNTTPLESFRFPEQVLIHELGHQFFYGILATHEMEEAFLDEGFNSYWEIEVMRSLYGEGTEGGTFLGRSVSMSHMRALRLQLRGGDLFEPVRKQPSWTFYPGSWADHIYGRPALILQTASKIFSPEALDAVFRSYAQRHAFSHPNWDDFIQAAHRTGPLELAAFLEEAFTRPEVPDVRVVKMSSHAWEPPLGRVPTQDGFVWVTPDNRAQHPHVGLDPSVDDPDGFVWAERIDSGFATPEESRSGGVKRLPLRPEKPLKRSPRGAVYTSEVLVRGPGWKHLPAAIRFSFDDGTHVRDAWGGRSLWRVYRFTRRARLVRVEIDPKRALVLDPTPANNALRLEPSPTHRAEWSLWLAAWAQWLTAGVGAWL